MQISITVRYINRNGAGKLQAKGSGVSAARRQLTIGYPHHLSNAKKYYSAAQQLAYKLENSNGWHLRLIGVEYCYDNSDRGVEVFHFEVFDQSVRRFDNYAALRHNRFPAGN